MPNDPTRTDRRTFLGAAAGTTGAAFADGPPGVAADPPPPVPAPRATSGDAVEPDWAERITVTVGSKTGDLVGTDDRVLQAAVDLVARYGGGTVRVLPGTYRLRNAIHLRPNLRLIGTGGDTVLVKEPSVTSKLVEDSDWYDQEVTLADARGFRLGDGVCLRARNPHNGGQVVLKRTLVARSGSRFKLDRPLRDNLWRMGDATAATLFPLLSGDGVSDVWIEGLCLDGNRPNNANLDGNYAGCIFLQDCARFTVRRVIARNYNGDGISWQICHDVTVEDCHSHGHAGLGLHPGSGSQRPVIRNNRLDDNEIGLFFCWGVRGGRAEGNRITDSRATGLSIGHRDTDNLIRDNEIRGSGRVGVLFRPERGAAFAPHRTRLENNRVVDSGPDTGVAVDIQGEVGDLHLVGNTLRETRGSARRVGVRIAAGVGAVRLDGNRIDGFATPVDDGRKRVP
ncbi:MAG: right-handed parallel beta-helix repeat-containing protein [Gemmataceae bacterium]